jgi:hypothetical protein
MAKRQRLRRPDPKRTAPKRQFSTMFRREGETAGAWTGPATGESDPISDAVRMGYSVIEDQIRQGKNTATKIWGSAPGIGRGAGLGTMTDIANRLLRFSTDLASLHFDLMTAVMHSPQSKGFAQGVAPTQSAGSRVIIEIESTRRNRVTVDLWPGANTSDLQVPALYSADASTEPLTEITLTPASEESPARLNVSVPNTQPAGIYSGLILDSESGQANGTLSLTLL